MDTLRYELPNDAKYFSTVRLMLSGILNLLNRDIEEIEDLKMAVTESLNIAHQISDNESINIIFEIRKENIMIYVKEIDNEKLESCEKLSLAKTIIECLVDDCHIEEKTLILTKKL